MTPWTAYMYPDAENIEIVTLLPGSVIFVKTENSIYRVEKIQGLRVNVKVLSWTGEQPEYMIEGFETEFCGMSNGRLSVLDGVLRVCNPAMFMGMAFKSHPSVKESHRLTSAVFAISDVTIPALENLDLNRKKNDGRN